MRPCKARPRPPIQGRAPLRWQDQQRREEERRQQAERGSAAERHRRQQDVRLPPAPPAPPAPSPDISLEERRGKPEDQLVAQLVQQPPARAAEPPPEPEPPRPPVTGLAPVDARARPPLPLRPAGVGGYTYLRAGSGAGGTLQLRRSPSEAGPPVERGVRTSQE